ncbi:MAG: TonB family protein [Caldimonas sp.]
MSLPLAGPRLSLGRVWPAASIAFALHGALFLGLLPAGGLIASHASPTAMIVRMLSPADSEAQAAPAGGAPPVARAAQEDAPVAQVPVAPRPSVVPEGQRQDRPGKPESSRKEEAPARIDGAGTVPAQPAKTEKSAYLIGARMDPGPRPIDDIEPLFPPEAGAQEGVVVLQIFINEAGIVDEVKVLRSSPKGYFEASAIAAFSAAKFSPGMVLGVPVKSQITIEVQFTPFNRGGTVSGRGY